MTKEAAVVFLLDVDNTLLDTDRLVNDLKHRLRQAFQDEHLEQYLTIFEARRAKLGYVDFLGALRRYRMSNSSDQHCLRISTFLLDYPFAELLYPRALDLVAMLRTRGRTVIVSDGDVVFQPPKIERSGLFHAVSGHILLYIHKEQELEDVEARYPSVHYIFVDDKPRILAAVKKVWGRRVTTVLPRQGHYAHDLESLARYPTPDVTIELIGDLMDYDVAALKSAAFASVASHPGIEDAS